MKLIKKNSIVIKVLRKIAVFCAIGFINFYKACISPLFPSCCRFQPTCSNYALEAYKKYGFILGTKLTLKRLSKCHPFGGRGYDPVPENLKKD